MSRRPRDQPQISRKSALIKHGFTSFLFWIRLHQEIHVIMEINS